MLHRSRRFMLCIFYSALLIVALPAVSTLAQASSEQSASGLPHILEFHAAENAVLHYLHEPVYGAPALLAESATEFPFRYVRAKYPVRKASLEAAETVAALIKVYHLAYDAERVDGFCQVQALDGGEAMARCAYDAGDLPTGNHFAALYHPDTLSLIALSTTAPPGARVVALDYRTYNGEWLRFTNLDENGNRRLTLDNIRHIPFQYVIGTGPRYLQPITDAARTQQLFERHDMSWNSEAYAGMCKSDSLSPDSMDVVCTPGACDMPTGYVFLKLHHPVSGDVVAVTSAIDNTDGRASRSMNCPQPPPDPGAHAMSSEDAQGQAMPAENAQGQTDDAPPGCGPYVPGQWIKRSEYEATGLDLPVVREVDARHISLYQCMAPAGRAAYLQAYPLRKIETVEQKTDKSRHMASYVQEEPVKKKPRSQKPPANSNSGLWCMHCNGVNITGWAFSSAEEKERQRIRCEEHIGNHPHCECVLELR